MAAVSVKRSIAFAVRLPTSYTDHYLCTYQLKPRPRWGFDLTSLQILANSHPTGAY